MADPSCPSCGLPLSDAAFAAGSCPCCDFRFAEEPVAVEAPVEASIGPALPIAAVAAPERGRRRPMLAGAGMGTAFACGIAAGYFLFARTEQPAIPSVPEVALIAPDKPKPLPDPIPQATTPLPPAVAAMPLVEPKPVAVLPPPKPILIDPLDNAERKLDAPDGLAEVVDLNGDDRIVLMGRIKVLKLNAVNGSVQLDASGLEAEEIILAGDINGNCALKFGARNGRVTIRGAVVGSCRVTVDAPGGSVTLIEGGRIGGGATATLTAKTVDAKGIIDEGAKVSAILTSGGTIRVASMDGGAVVTYKRSAPADPAPLVETGDLRGGTRVVEAK